MWKTIAPEADISVITCLGKDENGKLITDFLTKKGIDQSYVYIKDGITANNQLRVDEAGERFGIEGTWQGGLYETFLLSDTDWQWIANQDMVAMPGNNPNFIEMINRKHAKQLLSVDYLDIENNVPMEETIRQTDIAFISATLKHLDYYKKLSDKSKKLIVVTLGAQGSKAFYNGETYSEPAVNVEKVVDTTGCGDAYQAAFALTYFKSRNIQQAMNDGAKAASEILKYYGGVGKTNN